MCGSWVVCLGLYVFVCSTKNLSRLHEHHINWAIPQIIHTSLHKSTTLENTSWYIMSMLRTHCHHRHVEYWDYLSHFASDCRAAPRWRIPQTIPQIIRMAFHKLSTRNESLEKYYPAHHLKYNLIVCGMLCGTNNLWKIRWISRKTMDLLNFGDSSNFTIFVDLPVEMRSTNWKCVSAIF